MFFFAVRSSMTKSFAFGEAFLSRPSGAWEADLLEIWGMFYTRFDLSGGRRCPGSCRGGDVLSVGLDFKEYIF